MAAVPLGSILGSLRRHPTARAGRLLARAAAPAGDRGAARPGAGRLQPARRRGGDPARLRLRVRDGRARPGRQRPVRPALPAEYRARAFGVVQAGLQLLQGFAVLATGAARAALRGPGRGRRVEPGRRRVLMVGAGRSRWPSARRGSAPAGGTRAGRRPARSRPAAAAVPACRSRPAPPDADAAAARGPPATVRDSQRAPTRTVRAAWHDGAVTDPSFYEAVGGAPTFRRLVDEFYAGVADDPVLRPLYPEADLGPANDRLRMFLDAVLGRPEHLLRSSAATPPADAARAVPGRPGRARRLAAPHAPGRDWR